jgi:hypothetical protein
VGPETVCFAENSGPSQQGVGLKISRYLPRAGVLGVKKSEVDVGKRKAAAQS